MEEEKRTGLSSSAKGVFFAAGAQLLFSMSVLATKLTVENVSAMTLLSWRFTFAALAMTLLALVGVIKVRVDKKAVKALAFMALCQPVLYFIGETVGIQNTTASESGTIIACVPIVTLIFSVLFLKKFPTWKQTAGVLVSVVGIIIMVLEKGGSTSLSPLGYAALLLAVTSAAAFSILSDRVEDYTSVEKTYIMSVMGAVVFVLLAVAEHTTAGTLKEWIFLPFADGKFLVAALYLGVGCSVVAFFCLNQSIKHIGATRTCSFAGIITVMTVLSGVVVLGERLTLLQTGGIGMVLAGVYAANVGGSQPKEITEEEDEEAALHEQ